MMMCGVDEAGRGPMFGPLVVGAVYIEDDSVLREIGVKESKKLTPSARDRMFDQIAEAASMWCTVPLSAEEIDAQMKTQSLNMIELGLFVEAVGRIPTDVIYRDGSDPEKMHNYYSYLYNKCVFELLERERGVGEACLFARSATAGGQKFPVHWGGDCAAEYSAMAETLRGGLSLCASGFGFFSQDGCRCKDQGCAEHHC